MFKNSKCKVTKKSPPTAWNLTFFYDFPRLFQLRGVHAYVAWNREKNCACCHQRMKSVWMAPGSLSERAVA